MLFLKKLLTYAIIPPGSFVILFIFSGFVANKRWLKFLLLISGISLYLISITPIKDFSLYFLEKDYRGIVCKGDIIVLLGGGVNGSGELSEDANKRLVKGYLIHKREGLPIVVSGGRVNESIPFEADVLAKNLTDLGMSDKDIIMDKNSRDTFENVKFVKEILGVDKSIIIVTSAYHMKRSVLLFQKAGFNNICTEAADFKFDGFYSIYDFLPTSHNLNSFSKALKEYIGLLFYKI
ncbi:MAG: YdcF family protein [Calditerrivibrio sp.]|nr:YdcF family protein [Calditerrivibrio sp.]MCA1932861.1 YdcF family protein [Calditerrivibrio sp.]